MSNLSKLALIKEMIESAEASLRTAKQLLVESTGSSSSANIKSNYARAASNLGSEVNEAGKVIEGVFDGRNMIGQDKREHPVPANYASKSKLVPGDVMKLTIDQFGGFIYKQIGPVDRKRVVGPLTYEDDQYKVITNGRAYKVLLASVTFYHAEPGDEVILLIPEVGESEWGAIDNVVPKLQAELEAEEKIIKEAKETAGETEKEDESIIISDSDDVKKSVWDLEDIEIDTKDNSEDSEDSEKEESKAKTKKKKKK
jgi:hypothetical protein